MMQVNGVCEFMLGRLYENQNCSASRALELVGERWSLLILRDAMFAGFTRFSQFQKSLGVATNILTKRLEDFVADGLMERRQASAEQAEYVLTRKGLELKPVIIALTDWGDKWVRPGPISYRDQSDGKTVELQLRRPDSDKKLDVTDVVAVLR
jgi:DNA-binding HxlR family transcriptional regulator